MRARAGSHSMIFCGSPVPGMSADRTGDFCYVLDISRLTGDGDEALGQLLAETEEGISPGFPACGELLRPWETFICRTFDRAKELLMDADLLSTDWIRRYSDADGDGRILEVYLSTDGAYLGRITRAELF